MARGSWVVIGSANGSTNLGDECMWESAVSQLRDLVGPVSVVTDSHPGWTPPVGEVSTLPYLYYSLRRGRKFSRLPGGRVLEKVISRPLREPHAYRRARNLVQPTDALARRWFEAISEADGLIFSGAGAINDDFASHGIASWWLLARWALDLDTPIAMLGQGVGPVSSKESRRVAGELLSAPRVLSVRDHQSAAEVRSLAPSAAPVVAQDWALLSAPDDGDRERARRVARDLAGDSDFFCLSVHRRHDTDRRTIQRVVDVVASLIDEARGVPASIVFVPNMRAGGYADDRLTYEVIRSMLPARLQASLSCLPDDVTPRVTRAFLGLSKGLCSTRYHPLVFAASEQIPIVGLSYDRYYDQKLQGVAKLFDAGDVVRRMGSVELSGRWIVDSLAHCVVAPVATDDLAAISRPLERFVASLE